ncbi:mitochondrial large subunit ribosomal protein-domain-containing protein [Powellomyces hirtus]|nr:mitochondrial large subunit ribosomal protein-domain-containing protein [Powellomyces hirtus]
MFTAPVFSRSIRTSLKVSLRAVPSLPGLTPSAQTQCTALTVSRRYRGEVLGHRPQPTVMKTILIGDANATPKEFKDTLPYLVKRTSGAGWLPVYRAFIKGNTQIITTIRRIEGDVDRLAKDLETIIPKERIELKRTTNHVVLKGDYLFAVRDWLTARKF